MTSGCPGKVFLQLRSMGVDSAQAPDVRWPSWEQNFGGSYHGLVHRAASLENCRLLHFLPAFRLKRDKLEKSALIEILGWMIFTVSFPKAGEGLVPPRKYFFPTWQHVPHLRQLCTSTVSYISYYTIFIKV